MDLLKGSTPDSEATDPLAEQLQSRIAGRIAGDVRFDRLSRTLYSTDASLYEIIPVGVVLPKNIDDVRIVVEECRETGTSIIARGGGTGLTGGAVGSGVQLDFSRTMNRIGKINVEKRTVDVEPGVVLDELNHALSKYGLYFAPDVATSSRATLGGMIANNSCGAHSVVHGRTVDHVAELTVVLADGEVVTFGESAEKSNRALRDNIEKKLASIRNEHRKEIEKRFPNVLRSNGGYGLDRLGSTDTPIDVTKILCGSEGTLGLIVGAKLKLTPLPNYKGLVVLHFRDVLGALGATPEILKHNPVAIELIDHMIIEAGRSNNALRQRCDFLHGDPQALLIVEFYDDHEEQLNTRMNQFLNDHQAIQPSYAQSKVLDLTIQDDVWKLRTSGLGLLMSKPGDEQSYAFVEDSAVDPARLRDYIERFSQLLDNENVEAGYYAHASVGCIHVRPVLNLKKNSDVEKMKRIADGVSDLALEFSGAITGEHGDGLLRSCFLEKMYGPKIVNAFKQVKQLFDPAGMLNPNKIVDPHPMTEHLRFGSSHKTQSVKTHLDFSAYGGMAQLAGMCSGVGQCRQKLVGTMCPSFVATGDETHTTRARANALRIALSNRGLLDGLDDPHLAEVMDLCLSCKACKTECPTGVDMARLKSEYLAYKNITQGASSRARWIADMPDRLKSASRFPRMSNIISQSKLFRKWMENKYGLDQRIAPPKLAHQTFRKWFLRHSKNRVKDKTSPRGNIVYFVDTWTNYFTPQVGIAAVTLLERAGYHVVCPPTVCCGRPAISQGLLVEAKDNATTNVRRLSHVITDNTPIVGTEPSCVSALIDEYPQLVRTPVAKKVASQTLMIETFLHRLLDEDSSALRFQKPDKSIRYHAHCHQKALVGSQDAAALLDHVFGNKAQEINSGCCGMAGAFGYEVEHYDVATAIGEERLFPAVRERGSANIAVSGFSCRHQIEHHTDTPARHLIEHLADLLI